MKIKVKKDVNTTQLPESETTKNWPYAYKLFSTIAKYMRKGYSGIAISRKIQKSKLRIIPIDGDPLYRLIDITDSIISTDTIELAIQDYVQRIMLKPNSYFNDAYKMLMSGKSMGETFVELNNKSGIDIEDIMFVKAFIEHLKGTQNDT